MSRSILKHTSNIGIIALISRCIAFLREILLIRFLSVGATSDIFFTAFRIPNTMRKIFAEGVLSSILVPALVNTEHTGGRSYINKLTTLSFLIIETTIFLFCMIACYWSQSIMNIIAPGFSTEKIIHSAQLLKILMPFILFMSSGAIFAAALQAQKRFFIPAVAPAIANIFYISSLIICLYYQLSVEALSYFMIGTSIASFLLHLITYLYMQFKFSMPNKDTWNEFKIVMIQFFPCFLSVGILEINHFVNTGFGSFLPSGSLTLIRYSFQFVNIPIGIIAASLSTVLLPHFSKINLENPEALSIQIFEAIKFIIWSTLPICFLLGFFSKEIFETLFMGDSEAMSKIFLAQSIFIAYLVGLLAFSLNKVFLSIFYALRLSFVPMIATTISIIINFSLNKILLATYGAAGIAFAASVASIFQSLFFLFYLHAHLKLTCYWREYGQFFIYYFMQLSLFFSTFWLCFKALYYWILRLNFSWKLEICDYYITTFNSQFFLKGIGIWFWAGPLSLVLLGTILVTRKHFAISLSYFDKK